MKKRHIILICVALMIILGSFVHFTKPVLPYIQLPGEVYPGTQDWFGGFLPGLTNTFVATVVAWIIVVIVGLSLKARSRTADEIPTGFYNFFEMVVEGAYNFAENIAGPKVRDFFPFFMTFILFILVANWMELVPGVDSIGIWEYKPIFYAEKDIKAMEAEGEHLDEEHEEEVLNELIHDYESEQMGDLKVNGALLIRADVNADENAAVETIDFHHHEVMVGTNPEAAQWTIVPYLRAAATDLNFTLALALVSMFMVQYYGFKYLGASYLNKFFPFLKKGFGQEVGKNPIKAIDPAVGLLELVSEFSKIISFAFRLLGNIFAGQILLFVMAFLLPVANVVFFGLEFFVGLIQAAVFALLTLIFMASATESHDHDEHEH